MITTPPSAWRTPRAILVGAFLIMALFGCVAILLPLSLLQPFVGAMLGLINLGAFLLMLGRSREPGPEQRGWRIMAMSLIGVMVANSILILTPSTLNRISVAEALFFFLQPLLSVLQAWAVLSWPFRSPLRRSQLVMNLLGSLLFGGSLFLALWIASLRQAQGEGPVFFRMVGLSIRLSVLGGVSAYILAVDPRRVLGPMGWIFAGAAGFSGIIFAARPYLYDASGVMQASPLLGLTLSTPLAFCAAAWLRQPVEVPEDQPRLRFPWIEGLLYLPFAIVGALVFHTALRHREQLLPSLLGFMAVCILILARQFMLLREVRRANERLEERVLDRTRSLEDLQSILLRTERLNSVGVLGAGLAHDLNNALGVVRNYAELSRLRLEEGHPTTASDLDRIMVAADQSASLTGRLMAFARQEEDALGPLDLAGEVANLEHILRMLLPRNVSLAMELGNHLALVHGSRARLEQVLVNLVGNARDAMPDGGAIRIRLWVKAETEPPSACLEVSDTGKGMAPETLGRLFQPFFTTKAPGKGTGLGLASVKQLVEGSGGSIQVTSVVAQGTCFKMTFPLLN